MFYMSSSAVQKDARVTIAYLISILERVKYDLLFANWICREATF